MLVPMNNDVQQIKAAIRDCCTEVQWNITQAQELLKEAVDKLIEETLSLQRGCDASFQEMPGRQAGVPHEQALEQAHRQSSSLCRMVTERTSASLLQLQFQDMVTQLLEYAKEDTQRLAAMVLKAGEGEQSGGGVSMPDAGADVRKKKPVMSRDMQAGDVDLF